MPRNISPSMKLKMRSDSFSIATIVTITRRDGVVLAFTSWDVPILYNSLMYQPTASLQSNSVKQTASSGTDSLEVRGIIDTVLITDSDLINGKYDGALILLQEIDPTDLASGAVTLLNGYSGELNISEGAYTGEVRSKSQKMTQEFGDMCSGNCRVNQLGDSDCAPGGVFADGSTMASYRQSGTLAALDITVDPAGPSLVKAVNCGGPVAGSFSADTGFSGGNTDSTSASIDTSYRASGPSAIYQTSRTGNAVSGQPRGTSFSYNIGGLTAGMIYTVRLHFCEFHFPTLDQTNAALPGTTTGIGIRLFNVTINTAILLESFDMTSQAGGKNIAVNKEFTAQARTDGTIYINVDSVIDNGALCAIEILTQPLNGIISGLGFTSTPNEPSGTFNYGKVTFTSGLNITLSREIKTHYLSGGVTQIGLQEQFPYQSAVGDTATLEWGCDRLPVTCQTKFRNRKNIQCEPYVPGNAQLIATGRPPS